MFTPATIVFTIFFFTPYMYCFRQRVAISASKILTNTLPVAAFPKRFLIIIGQSIFPIPMCRIIHC